MDKLDVAMPASVEQENQLLISSLIQIATVLLSKLGRKLLKGAQ